MEKESDKKNEENLATELDNKEEKEVHEEIAEELSFEDKLKESHDKLGHKT